MLFYIGITDRGVCKLVPKNATNLLNHSLSTENLYYLDPGLPLELAQTIIARLKTKGKEKRTNEILKAVKKYPGLNSHCYQWKNSKVLINASSTDINSNNTDLLAKTHVFSTLVQGRQLSEADLQRLAQELKLNYDQVIELCHMQVEKGIAEWLPAIKKLDGVRRCMRCGEIRLEEWSSIYGATFTCPTCKSLGALSSLQVIFRNSSKPCLTTDIKVKFNPKFELSEAQKHVSQEILSFVSSQKIMNSKREILIWAACGAGKTEVCFPATALALSKGQKVLFAAPRQDVVLDVAPRLERDFPGLEISVLTGVSPQRYSPANFVLATTHQVLRFYQAFDLIFLDEIDAFPYYGNEALAWGLNNSLKPQGKIVYLTATPSEESLIKVNQGKMKLIRLPARHHRKPVPVPEWINISRDFELNITQGRQKDENFINNLRELSKDGPVILFVPKISWVDIWVKALKKIFPKYNIAGSFSADPNRKVKIENLRNGNYQIFVSTSILERGVTIPNAQVIVVAADHMVFNARALVQMAGRVGRTSDNPQGRALFFSRVKTKEIQKAIYWIEEQNKLALDMGLIDH